MSVVDAYTLWPGPATLGIYSKETMDKETWQEDSLQQNLETTYMFSNNGMGK